MAVKVYTDEQGNLRNANGDLLATNVFNLPADHPRRVEAEEAAKLGVKALAAEIDARLIEELLKRMRSGEGDLAAALHDEGQS